MVSKRSKAAEALARALEQLGGISEKRLNPVKALTDEKMAPYPGVRAESIEIMRHWQEMRDRRNYTPAPIIPIEPKPVGELKWWDYVEVDRKEISRRDNSRLDANFQAWTTPVNSYGIGENRAPYHVFFAILDDNGVSKSEFDWKAFRETYFSINPQQRGKFAENSLAWRKSDKGKQAKRAYDRKRKAQRRQENRRRQSRGGLF